MQPKELTLRGLILGVLLTTVFTAANVYLGLKVGLTFASSIPAAVISMAILSAVKNSSILENNIVQTVASAAGTLSAIIFVLPGLVIVGWWTQFPFWQTFLICLSGGVLGVLFTIPLRRALVTNSDLPYPEGVAAAEVLKVGSGTRGETTDDTGEAKEGLRAVILGSAMSAGLAILSATRIVGAELNGFIRLGGSSERSNLAGADQTGNAEYPSLHLRHHAFRQREIRAQKSGEQACPIGMGHPGGGAEGIVLVGRAAFRSEAALPQCWIDLGDSGAASGYVPTVEGPEVDLCSEALADETQPGNSCVRRLRDLPLNIKVKDGFRAAGTLICQPAPASITLAGDAVANCPLANKIDINVIAISGPVVLEIVQEGGPVRL